MVPPGKFCWWKNHVIDLNRIARPTFSNGHHSSSSTSWKGSGTVFTALNLPALFRCSFSNLDHCKIWSLPFLKLKWNVLRVLVELHLQRSSKYIVNKQWVYNLLPVEIPQSSSNHLKRRQKQPGYPVINMFKGWMDNCLQPSQPEDKVQSLHVMKNFVQNRLHLF